MATINITPFYKARDYQKNFIRTFEDPSTKIRRFLVCWPRRAGKDLSSWILLVRAAHRRVGNYFYMLPTYNQCRKVIMDTLVGDSGMRFIDFIAPEFIKDFNKSELKILLGNGSLITLCGSDSYNRIVGTNPRGIVWSEAALCDLEQSYIFLSQALLATDGWAIFISTPRGRNKFYEFHEIARQNPKQWFCERLTIDDTKHVDAAVIKKEIDSGLLSQDMYEQEWRCSFSAGVEGSYYSRYLNDMRLKGRITTVEWNPSHNVHVALDLGYSDETSIIFFQLIGPNVYIIDCYQNNKMGLEHYITHIKSKPYTYGKFIAPHDIKVHDFSTGNTRWEKARQLGITFTVCDNIDIADGIESVRSALAAKIWIDEVKCKQLLHCLESYRQEYDSKRQVYKDKPLHDFSSHYSDAMRYLCVSLPKISDGVSKEELAASKQRALYGTQTNVPKPLQDMPGGNGWRW